MGWWNTYQALCGSSGKSYEKTDETWEGTQVNFVE